MKYKFTARTKEGRLQKGELEAGSRGQIVDLLHGRGLVVINVEESSGFSLAKLNEINIGGVPLNEKVVFMRQLATMVSAGLPLTQSLHILEAQAQNMAFKRALKEIVSSIEGGKGLADSMAQQEGIFNPITINLVRAGEESGNLDEIFLRLADQMESDREFRGKVRTAMMYPGIISVAMVAVVIIVIVTMVPQMTELYEEFDADLPLPTLMLVALSNLFVGYWWLLAGVLVVLVASFISYRRSPAGRQVTDRLSLRVPVLGKLIKDTQTAEFARTMAMLMTSGLPIVKSLDIVANSLSNIVFSSAIEKSARALEKGVPLAKPIAEEENFPLIVSQMIAVGEETGNVDVILTKLASYFTEEVNHTVNNLTSLMEPFILIVMGVVIGFIAVSIYLPIFNIAEVMG